MGLYSRFVLPRVVHYACGQKPAMKQRRRIIPLATGRVLEIGIGSGLNVPYYDPGRVSHLWGLDPSREMWAIARRNALEHHLDAEFIEAGAEAIPLDDAVADTVVVTYTLCTVPDVARAVASLLGVSNPKPAAWGIYHVTNRGETSWHEFATEIFRLAGIDVPTYVSLIGEGRDAEAIDVIRRDCPFPWVCGLVCTRPCEFMCVRARIDTPISIKSLKGFAAERAMSEGSYRNPEKAPGKDQKVCVIGAGPAWAACSLAAYLKLCPGTTRSSWSAVARFW